jgi:DNA-directed RNA polymerase subunit omega
MSRQHDSMIYPSIETLLGKDSLEGSKFALVTLASYRARQINSYFNQLGEGLGQMVPPQVSSVARKPLSIAFEEIAAEKIVKIERLPYDEMEADADEIFGADSEFNASDADESDAE